MVDKPKHYDTPMGFQAIEICKHYGFALGNALKYIFRAGKKTKPGEDSTEQAIEDLEKAIYYLNYQIEELKNS